MSQPSIRTNKQKLLMALPIFIIAVAGLIAGAIHIRSGATTGAKKTDKKSAFNTQLPSPDLPVKEKNKFELYMEAARDSARIKAEWEKDPTNKRVYDPGHPPGNKPISRSSVKERQLPSPKAASTRTIDPNEQKVNDRLQKLYAALHQTANGDTRSSIPFADQRAIAASNPETDRLEKLVQLARTPDTTTDPNLARVEKVLDKVLEIQHPERTKEKLGAETTTTKPTPYEVTTIPKDTPETITEYAEEGQGQGPNSFYGLEQSPQENAATNASAIQAEVQETQTLQNGSTIKLRLLQDIFVAGRQIPANNLIYGTCTVNNERLHVQLTSAVADNQLYPISLKVYDLDGLEGIFVPGAITRDVTKEGLSLGISGMGITSVDPSLGAQAAAAGIETAKTLLSRKIKAVVVTVNAGHRVLLQNPRTGH